MAIFTKIRYAGIYANTVIRPDDANLPNPFRGFDNPMQDFRLRIQEFSNGLRIALSKIAETTSTVWEKNTLIIVLFPEFFFRGGPRGWYPGGFESVETSPVPPAEAMKATREATADWMLNEIQKCIEYILLLVPLQPGGLPIGFPPIGSHAGILVCAGTAPIARTVVDPLKLVHYTPVDHALQKPFLKIDNFSLSVSCVAATVKEEQPALWTMRKTIKWNTAGGDFPDYANSRIEARRERFKLNAVHTIPPPNAEDKWLPALRSTIDPRSGFVTFDGIQIYDTPGLARDVIFSIEICLDFVRNEARRFVGARMQDPILPIAADIALIISAGLHQPSEYRKEISKMIPTVRPGGLILTCDGYLRLSGCAVSMYRLNWASHVQSQLLQSILGDVLKASEYQCERIVQGVFVSAPQMFP